MKKNKLLLLSVGRPFFKGAIWGSHGFEFPINLGYTAAFLKKNNVELDVLDLQVEGSPLGRLKKIDLRQYYGVGFNAGLASTYAVYSLAQYIKSQNSKLKVFSFGIHTVLKDIILKECPSIDYVVYGESEHSVLDLVRAISTRQSLEGIKGVIYRNKAVIAENPPREYEENPDIFPYPARELFNMKKYVPSPGKHLVTPQMSVLTSRGCNWNCFFCSRLRGGKIRFRSPENIVCEIEELISKFGANEISFIDDTFTADKDRIWKFIALMKKIKKVHLRACSRVDTVDEEILKGLKDIGLYSIGYGIESGSDKILSFNRKDITKDRIRKTIRMTKKIGLETRGFFMLNLPCDTIETTDETVRFIKELEMDLVNVQITYPWPFTPMRDYVLRNYQINKELWNNWEACEGDDVIFIQPGLPEKYIKETYNKIIRAQYLNVKFIVKWLKRIKSVGDLYSSALQCLHLITLAGRKRKK